jgi:integrase
MKLRDYAALYLTRPQLERKTAETYEGHLRLHILPDLGDTQLGKLNQAAITRWHDQLCRGPLGANTVAKCYRTLRAILNLAVHEGRISTNPCALRGAGREHITERPIATVEQVLALADMVHPVRTALVLTAAFSQLRLGELLELRRSDVNPLLNRVVVTKANVELSSGEVRAKAPKTHAGQRTVHLPQSVMTILEDHMAEFVASGEDSYVFVGVRGGQLRRSVLSRDFGSAVSRLLENPANANLQGLTFHDLRHTGATHMAQAGATLKELMARLGHESSRAALIYQHATADRDRRNADAVDRTISQARAVTPTRVESERSTDLPLNDPDADALARGSA